MKKIVIGNWKMNSDYNSACEFFKNVKIGNKIDCVICPPNVYIQKIIEQFKGNNIEIGAQNVHQEKKGAHTGEVSSEMLLDIGCKWVIIGHSERRAEFKESNDLIAKKCLNAYNSGLNPIFCIGETLEERNSNKTMEVLITQINSLIEKHIDIFDRTILAYEPVWAIGTGVTATPEQAEDVHKGLKEHIKKFKTKSSDNMRIVYGGSVTPENAGDLIKKPNISGFLVGGASLKSDSFTKICEMVS